jgi:hypothetical protein
MKTVFKNYSALAHIWANQLQSYGRSNNMFFDGNTIYSYGKHYQIANILETESGQKICFVNSNSYSNSTSNHTRHVLNSIPKNIKYFYIPFKSNYINKGTLIDSIDLTIKEIETLIKQQLRANNNYNYYNHAFKLWGDILEICDLFNIELPNKPNNFNEAEQKSNHLKKTVIERKEKKEAKAIEKQKENLIKWLNNEYNGQFYNIPIYLRLSKDKKHIETSRGAKVEFNTALSLYSKILNKQSILNEKINGFTILDLSNEKITVGCHIIELNKVHEFFNTLKAC